MAQYSGYKIVVRSNYDTPYFVMGGIKELENRLTNWCRDGKNIISVEKVNAISRSRKQLKPNQEEEKWITSRMQTGGGFHYLTKLDYRCGPKYGGHVFEVIVDEAGLNEQEQAMVNKLLVEKDMTTSRLNYLTTALWFYLNTKKHTLKESKWLYRGSGDMHDTMGAHTRFMPDHTLYKDKNEYNQISNRITKNLNKSFELAGQVLGYCWDAPGWVDDLGGFILVHKGVPAEHGYGVSWVKKEVPKITLPDALEKLKTFNETENAGCHIKRTSNEVSDDSYDLLVQLVKRIDEDDILVMELLHDDIPKATLCDGFVDYIAQKDYSPTPNKAIVLFHKKGIGHIATMFESNHKVIEYLYNNKGV